MSDPDKTWTFWDALTNANPDWWDSEDDEDDFHDDDASDDSANSDDGEPSKPWWQTW